MINERTRANHPLTLTLNEGLMRLQTPTLWGLNQAELVKKPNRIWSGSEDWGKSRGIEVSEKESEER